MPTAQLTLGPVHTLVAGTTYAAPPRACRATVLAADTTGAIQISPDNSTWQTVTLDSNFSFILSSAFIRAQTVNAQVVCKI